MTKLCRKSALTREDGQLDGGPSQDSEIDEVWLWMKRWSILLCRVFGVEVRMHFSMVILPVLFFARFLAHSRAISADRVISLVRPFIIIHLVIFGCVIVHELAHAMAARLLEAPVKGVLLHALGGACVMTIDPAAPRRNLVVIVAGPIANLALAGILNGFDNSPMLKGAAEFNRAIALLNLIPIFPMDGSRILQNFLKLRWGSSPVVDRIVLFCSASSCLIIGGVAIHNQDAFLLSLVVLSFVLAKWLLTPDAQVSEPCSYLEEDSFNSQGGGPKASHVTMIMVLLIFLSFPDTIATDSYGASMIELNQPFHKHGYILDSAKPRAAVKMSKSSTARPMRRKVRSAPKSRRLERTARHTHREGMEQSRKKKRKIAP